MEKVVIHKDATDFSFGLSYVCFSRVRSLKDILVVPVKMEYFTL